MMISVAVFGPIYIPPLPLPPLLPHRLNSILIFPSLTFHRRLLLPLLLPPPPLLPLPLLLLLLLDRIFPAKLLLMKIQTHSPACLLRLVNDHLPFLQKILPL